MANSHEVKPGFGLACPLFPFEETARWARYADRHGFDGVWVPDFVAYRPAMGEAIESLTALASLARETERVTLGTFVLGVNRRHPAMLALTACSIDLISKGRFILGLGTGGSLQDLSFGMPYRNVVEKMRETIEVFRLLGRQRQVTYKGAYFHLNDATIAVAPHGNTIPVWVAAQNAKAYRVAGELGDGWFSNWVHTPKLFRNKLDIVRSHAVAAGREAAAIVPAFEAAVALDTNRQRAEEIGLPEAKKILFGIAQYRYGLRQLQELGFQGERLGSPNDIPDDLARSCTLVGTPDYVCQRIEAYLAAGVEYFLFLFLNFHGIDLFVDEVMPRFRSGSR